MTNRGHKGGFSTMTPARQQEIARKGGIAAHAKGVAHEFTSEEARAAGRKGGRKVASDKGHMSRIGKAGGQARARRREASAE